MARENRLWEWMRGALRGTAGLHLVRVENLCSVGDPDVEGCYNGMYFEIELKGCDRPDKDGRLDFEVRQSQLLYHRRRVRCGGNTWLYARVGQGTSIRRYLVPGHLVYGTDWENITEELLTGMCVLAPTHDAFTMLERVCKR
jgi:hypothetical protein